MNAPMEPIPVRTFDTERRTFLKAGVAGSALLMLGRWLPAAAAPVTEPGATPKFAYTNVTDADVAMLRRVIPVMLAGALPADRDHLHAAIDAIVRGVDVTIGYQPPAVRGEISDLFGLLTRGLTRALVAGVWSSWKNASDSDVRAFLTRWRDSRLSLLRSAYIGLNNLIVGSWYGDPASWARIGYDGPPKLS